MVMSFGSFVRVGFLVVASIATAVTFAQDSYQQEITLPNGETAMIDWSAGQLQATGLAVAPSNVESEAQGEVLARRGAVLDAQRMLIEVIGGVRLDAETTMLNAMANDVVRSRAEGVVQGALVQEEAWDGEIYTVTLELPLERVASTVGGGGEGSTPPPEAPTGLVIDARDLNVTPALRIDVYDATGNVVLSSVTALYNPSLPSLAGDAGQDPLEEAQEDQRVGDRPVVVTAHDVRDNRVDLVVSQAAGARLLEQIGGDPHANPFTAQNTFIVAN